MSVKTLYTCDRCKKESWVKDELKIVTVYIGTKAASVYSGLTLVDGAGRSMDMCYECRKTLGIQKVEPEKGAPEPTYPTLEEMLREIVREEICAADSV